MLFGDADVEHLVADPRVRLPGEKLQREVQRLRRLVRLGLEDSRREKRAERDEEIALEKRRLVNGRDGRVAGRDETEVHSVERMGIQEHLVVTVLADHVPPGQRGADLGPRARPPPLSEPVLLGLTRRMTEVMTPMQPIPTITE